jgi:hypothetical protein
VSDIRELPIGNQTGDRTWKDTIVRQCICGSDQFYAVVKFDEEGEMAGYFTEGICFSCHSWVKLPTPIDPPIGT